MTDETSNLTLSDDDRAIPGMKLSQQFHAAGHARHDSRVPTGGTPRRVTISSNSRRLQRRNWLARFGTFALSRVKGHLGEAFEQGLREGKRARAGSPTASFEERRPLDHFFVRNGVEVKPKEALTAICCEGAVYFPPTNGVGE